MHFRSPLFDIFNLGPSSKVSLEPQWKIHNVASTMGVGSDWFLTERGIRRGCPLSPLFNFFLILVVQIRGDKVIRGIDLQANIVHPNTKIKQFADMNINYAKWKWHQASDSDCRQFWRFFGLTFSKGKSEASWLESRNGETVNQSSIPMSSNKIRILVIYFSANKEASLTDRAKMDWKNRRRKMLQITRERVTKMNNPTLYYGKVILAK